MILLQNAYQLAKKMVKIIVFAVVGRMVQMQNQFVNLALNAKILEQNKVVVKRNVQLAKHQIVIADKKSLNIVIKIRPVQM
ncbi:unnamed protein product (macronuclear) [Paramecium tetraurelia]|uniref:Uncharacterized protein n=1 Tax=Paramecium tetraurelia TaxID=5888 RepID=A0BGV7_PARTE|nr:uncharacterized protein GSPATT00028809001 [Paramecium tetraurelia]CAK57774.1 unnamed protein product [Paramecium tetraurelia]|eukprot:XP_001425172.1 hypothetical protein (macronuclear) [Paramecium tetraurelia strain d4-2]